MMAAATDSSVASSPTVDTRGLVGKKLAGTCLVYMGKTYDIDSGDGIAVSFVLSHQLDFSDGVNDFPAYMVLNADSIHMSYPGSTQVLFAGTDPRRVAEVKAMEELLNPPRARPTDATFDLPLRFDGVTLTVQRGGTIFQFAHSEILPPITTGPKSTLPSWFN